MDITTDPLLDDFISEKRSPNTRKRTTIHLRHYCNYSKQTPTELIKEAWHENRSDLPPWERGLKHKLKGFKEHLENKRYSEETVKESITAIRSFYSFFEIPLPRTTFQYKETDTTHRVVNKVSDLPGREDIQLALDKSNDRMKAIITLMASSGMEASTIRKLTINSFIDSLGDMVETTRNDMIDIEETQHKIDKINGPVLLWNIRRQKLGVKGEDYYTFSTPESIDTLLTYLGEKPPENLTDPLFRTREGKMIGATLFGLYFTDINKKCKFGKLGRYIYFRSHNLRKFFGNMMDPVLGRRDTDYLMGHQREKNKTDRSYYQPDMKTLQIAYRQHLGRVTFLEEIRYREVTDDELDSILEEKFNDRMAEMEAKLMKQYKDEFDRLPK